MTLKQAEKRVQSQARQLNVIDQDVIETCTKMYMNNPTVKSSRIKKSVEQMLRRAMPETESRFDDMAEMNRHYAAQNLPSSMR